VFEIGLGLGRTFNHLRHYLPERDIVVFDRVNTAYPDCMPDEGQLILGEFAETLPAAANRFAGRVILVHSDIGSFDRESNRSVASLVGSAIGTALAPGAIVLSDLPLEIDGCTALRMPEGVTEDHYYLYRRRNS